MRHAKIIIVAVTCLAASLQLAVGQRFNGPMPKNTVPETIMSCYQNFTAFNRLNRQPMHIDNLITIIRKIESKTFGEWDIRRIARTLVHRYMFDGIEYNPDAKLEFQYNQKSVERMKSMMIKELIPIPEEEILPHGVLDNDEMCALHWMLSHSMNATMRDDEPGQGIYGYSPGSGSGYNPNSNNPNNGGNNPFGGNNNNNPYGNNNNGNNYNNPSMGNNYNRGKREVNALNNPQDSEVWKSDGNSESAEDATENPETLESNVNQPLTNNENEDKSEEKRQETENKDDSHEDVDILDQNHLGGKSMSTEKSGKQISVAAIKTTRRPIETGVVYTKWGSISAGRLIAGIAAGMMPMAMSPINGNVYEDSSFSSGSGYGGVGGSNSGSGGFGGSNSGGFGGYGGSNSGSGNPGYGGNSGSNAGGGYGGSGNYNPSYKGNDNPNQYGKSSMNNGRRNRKKRQAQTLVPIKGLYAATLAGDVGQAAILNGQNNIAVAPPTGAFNNTICPREFVLEQHPDPKKEIYDDAHSWTYLTVAEIRGGLDGIIIGSNIRTWETRLRLSDILSMYYSETGVSVPGEQNYRSCDRSSLYSQFIDSNTLKDQSTSFASLYNNKTKEISDQTLNPQLLDSMVREARDKMNFAIGSLTSVDARCTQQSGGGSMNDNNKYTTPKLTVYAVLDHSVTNVKDIEDQKMFFGQLVHFIGVNPTGSRLGVIDGNSGSMVISPNWTDSSSILACRILSLPTHLKSQDYSRVMTNIKTEIEKVRNDEISKNYTNDNGVVVLLMVQGRKLEDGQREDIKRITSEINQIYGGVSVIASSSRYGESDFEGIKFLRIQPNANLSDAAAEFATSLVKNTHGALRYPTCNAFIYDQDYEHTNFINTYVSPDEIKYIKISPDYFFSARNLVLRFTAENGKVRICQARDEQYPNSGNEGSNGVGCAETKGSYVEPGKSETDIEFTYKQPCGKKGKKEDCRPIYLSITPTSSINQGETSRLDCSREPCQSPNQVRVTFTHWDMRCNGAIKTLFSSTLFIITSLVTIMNLFKNF